MEATTGTVIYSKDMDMRLSPASITKIMTLLLIFEALESGLVSLGSAKPLVHSAILCNRLVHVGHTGGIITAVSLIVSLIIMLFLTVFGATGTIPSLYVALYQIFWMLPALIITRLFIK